MDLKIKAVSPKIGTDIPLQLLQSGGDVPSVHVEGSLAHRQVLAQLVYLEAELLQQRPVVQQLIRVPPVEGSPVRVPALEGGPARAPAPTAPHIPPGGSWAACLSMRYTVSPRSTMM